MAKLQSDDLILDVRFSSFEDEWVNYDIKFYWKDEIIVNDNILKRISESKYWSRRDYGTFVANDYEKDYLIVTIKKVLDTNKSECWEPMEPDAKIAIYPGIFFPFLETRYNFFKEMEEIRIEKEKHGKNPDDLFTVIAFIDEYNFKNAGAYSGQGISLHLIVERKDLEKFVTDLEIEYDNFFKKPEEGVLK